MKRTGFTVIEVFAAAFVLLTPIAAMRLTPAGWSPWLKIGTAMAAGTGSVIVVSLFYRWVDQRTAKAMAEAQKNDRLIYRVVTTPTNPHVIVLPQGAEIQVGDYGWEAGSNRGDGRIYLQGLTADWEVVWHAGLAPNEIERVGPKPRSQYEAWHPYWQDPPDLPACPFPVLNRATATAGRPHYRHRYFVVSQPDSAGTAAPDSKSDT